MASLNAFRKAHSSPARAPALCNTQVRRKGEAERFAAHAGLANRRLLWHGTNVAVVAAVLKTGLRIMPHSGGRVGKGIYLASEHSKSAAYVRCGKVCIHALE